MGIAHSLERGGLLRKKINGLVLIDSYALINRLGFGEARSDLCNGCLQKIENAYDLLPVD